MMTKEKVIELSFLGEDDFSIPTYKDNRGKVWKDVESVTGELEGNIAPKELFYSSSNNEIDGEAETPMIKHWKYKGSHVVVRLLGKPEASEDKFNYMMLGRLKSDCENTLYPYNNCRIEDIPGVIVEMKRLWNSLIVKPEWLSMDEILKLEELLPLSKKSYDDGYEVDYSEAYKRFTEDLAAQRAVKWFCTDCTRYKCDCNGVLESSSYTACVYRKIKSCK